MIVTRRNRWGPLIHRDYRILLIASTLGGAVMPVHFLTQVFWVKDEYPDSVLLLTSLVAASRGLGMLLFALVGGAIADRLERRRILLACESATLAANGAIAALMLAHPFGDATVAGLVILTFVAGGIASIDQPARSASIPATVGLADLGPAISLNMLAMQISMPLSLPLAGFLNGAFAPGSVYAGSLLMWAVILPLIVMLRYKSGAVAQARSSMIANIRDGLRYTFHHRLIFAVLALLFLIQVVGMPGVANPLGPIWMTDVLGLSRAEFGLMGMTWGGGAMLGSIWLARRQDLARSGTTLAVAAAAFALGELVFGYSRNVPVTGVANAAIGVAFSAVLLISSTIVQRTVAEELRGRVMGLFPLILGLAMVNSLPVGAFAQGVGLEIVVPLLGWVTLALALFIFVTMPVLRRRAPDLLPGPAVPAPAD